MTSALVERNRGRQHDAIAEAMRAQCDIEDLIAGSSEADALSRLQDFVADYAPSLRDPVLALRERHEAVRLSIRLKGADPTAINRIRSDILEMAFAAADLAVESAPAPLAEAASYAPVSAMGAPAPRDAGASVATADPRPMSAPPKRKSMPAPTAPDETVICRVDGVTRSFGRGRFSLQPVSFDIRRGEITAIAGRNASGKTTLLRILMGELLPSGGSVSYPGLAKPGKPRDWMHIKSQIASLPQLPEKWHGRLRHNLNYVAASYGRSDQDLAKFIDWHMARFELLPFRDAGWDEISGGYKIRFELVRALLTQPRLLVLDEPLAYLDVVARDRFLRDIRAIADSRENPIPIVVTSQHLSEIEAVADQIVLLDDGALRYNGRVDAIADERRDRIVEVALDASRSELETALSGANLLALEATLEGFILAFPKTDDLAPVYARLSAAFGPRFTMMRDITGSVRAIMSDLGKVRA